MSVSDGLKVVFTEFEAADSLEGNRVVVPWNDFVRLVLEQGFFFGKTKLSLPLLVPVEFTEGTMRKVLENVEYVTMGALDFDELREDQFEDVLARIVEEGLEAIVYSTWGHPSVNPLYKFRVLLPFSRPVEKSEWSLFWPLLNGILGSFADRKCQDPSRGYFVPAAPEGTNSEDLILLHLPGDVVDVDFVLSGVDTLKETDLADISDSDKEHIDRDRLKRFAKQLSRSTIEYKAWMGTLLLKVLKGEPFAEKGNRDNTIYKLAKDLGEAFPEGDSNSIANHFEASLSHMGGDDAPSVADVRDKIQRAQRLVITEKLKKNKTQIVREQKVREKIGAPVDYDKNYIEKFCEETKCGATFELFSQRLIIQKNNKYNVFCAGTYVTFTEKELPNACRDLLKPAERSLGANPYNVTDKGLEIPKSTAQLVHDYGVVARKEEIRLYSNHSYYEEATHTMVEAPYPLRSLDARRHPEVDAWIDAVCGIEEVQEVFRDWLAAAPDLRNALSFLVFVGKTGTGKTSFAKGLSRLWTTAGCTEMHKAFNQFNSELCKSPVLLADEELPKDDRGRVLTAQIRSLVSSGEHSINPKNKDFITLKGFFRTIAAVQGVDKLDFGYTHSKEDIEAIQRRTLIIPVGNSAGKFFNYDLFVERNAIAEHSLYLQKTRNKLGGRFGIGEYNVRLLDLLKDETTERVLEWALWFLQSRKLEEENSLPAFVSKGLVYVSESGINNFWEACFSRGEKAPKKRHLFQAMSLLRGDLSQVRVLSASGVRHRYSPIMSDLLLGYAQQEGLDLRYLKLQLQRFTSQLTDSVYVRVPRRIRPSPQDVESARFAERQLLALRDADPDEDEEEEELDLLRKAE